MILAIVIAGPAVMLAIMAWAADKFLPVPTFGQQRPIQAQRKEGTPAGARLLEESSQTSAARRTVHDVVLELDRAPNAKEFEPLGLALGRFELKRMKSMVEDHYPDPHRNRYVNMDVAESASQRIIFQRNGPVRVEPKPTYVRKP